MEYWVTAYDWPVGAAYCSQAVVVKASHLVEELLSKAWAAPSAVPFSSEADAVPPVRSVTACTGAVVELAVSPPEKSMMTGASPSSLLAAVTMLEEVADPGEASIREIVRLPV